MSFPPNGSAPPVHILTKNGPHRESVFNATFLSFSISTIEEAHILQKRAGEVYVHYVNTDKRLDEWVPETNVREIEECPPSPSAKSTRKRKRGRPRSSSVLQQPLAGPSGSSSEVEENGLERILMTEEDYDIEHHKRIVSPCDVSLTFMCTNKTIHQTAQRNFDKVNFGAWQIKTWYVFWNIYIWN
jgi:histone acetyltransferase MYST1